VSKDTAARTRSRAARRGKADGTAKGDGGATASGKARGKARGNGKGADAGAVVASVRRTADGAIAKARGNGRRAAAGSLKRAAVERFDQVFVAEPRNRLALNAVTAGKVQVVARNREAVVRSGQRTFSHLIKTPDITNQKQSGRCWMFAGLNVLRVEAMKRLNVEQFEFSQSYLQFYDKLEKANWFLETMIATADEPTDGRLISFLLQDPIQDGGQWDMFADLVRKYGVVPKSVMPEAESSGESMPMNGALRTKLREYAAELRRCKVGGEAAGALRRRKDAMLETIHRMLAIHLGRPPRTFDWQWRDKDDEFHRDGELTPHEFYERYVGLDLDDFVSLINCPTADKPFGRLYTVQYLGNVVGGTPVRYVNVEIDAFKKAAAAQIAAGEPVWFGCDVGKMAEREQGALDREIYDLELLYETTFSADKAERVEYGHSVMTHAMVLTGVDLDDKGRPRKWKVENSWGDKVGDKGYFVMSDAWFDEYMFEVVIARRHLPKRVLKALETEPVVLPPWDPMGSLARDC
jgi:bleomycin hydrolase